MKFLSIITRVGLIVLALALVTTVASDTMWQDQSSDTVTTSDLASSLLLDWSFAFILLGALLSIAMVGAAYLARDERMENQLYEFGGEEE